MFGAYDFENRSSAVTADTVRRLGFKPSRTTHILTTGTGRRRHQRARAGFCARFWRPFLQEFSAAQHAEQEDRRVERLARRQQPPADVDSDSDGPRDLTTASANLKIFSRAFGTRRDCVKIR